MAKQAIPEELDALIQEYLTDGIITDKERQVLLRKAEKLGLDVDEIDLYIDAQQQKVDQQVDSAVRKQRGQTCPFCGGSVPQLADKCPHCGQNITAEASEELKEIIDNLEDALVELKSGKDLARSKANVERYMRKANLYYSNNPKIKLLIEQVNIEMAAANKNEFRVLIDDLHNAIIKLKSDGSYRSEENRAIVEKYLQSLKLYNSDDPNIEKIIKKAESELSKMRRKEFIKKNEDWLPMVVIFGVLLLCALIGWLATL